MKPNKEKRKKSKSAKEQVILWKTLNWISRRLNRRKLSDTYRSVVSWLIASLSFFTGRIGSWRKRLTVWKLTHWMYRAMETTWDMRRSTSKWRCTSWSSTSLISTSVLHGKARPMTPSRKSSHIRWTRACSTWSSRRRGLRAKKTCFSWRTEWNCAGIGIT